MGIALGLDVHGLVPRAGRPSVSIIEEDGAAASFDLATADHRATQAGVFDDGAVAVSYAARLPEFRRSARVQTRDRAFGIETTHPLGSVVPLGADRSSFLYFLVTELPNSEVGGLDVDLTVRRYRSDGTFSAMARVPVRGRWSHPRTAVSIAPNGDAIALVTERTRTTIVRLAWVPVLAPLTAIRTLLPTGIGLANAATPIPNSRASAFSVADSYQNTWWTCTSEMLSRSCGGALLPSYIAGIGSYKEIPYCWGGNDTPSSFIANINSPNNRMLGDANGNVCCWRGCTAGADCSGFGYITQSWGITSGHQSTETLLNWVTNSPGQSQSQGGTLYMMDMWRLPNSHVRMHYSYPGGGGGEYMYEESIYWGERAWFAFRPWSDYPNYLWCLGNFSS